VVNDSMIIDIKKGRHPVIEKNLPPGEEYIANDVFLDTKQQIIIITGPNMSGKSALLRQTALIVLMAQMGSFVPAGSARHRSPLIKYLPGLGHQIIFHRGESTFMVEMNEAASILNNISGTEPYTAG
jgi:DNA mismatch repair protein MutS